MTRTPKPPLNAAPVQEAATLVRALLKATAADQVTVPRQTLEALLPALASPEATLGCPILLTVEQAAARLHIAPATLYKRAKGLPFTVKISHRVLRFDEAKLAAWLADRAA